MLIRVSRDKDIFEWMISISAGIAALLLIFRAVYGKQHLIAEYGALLGAGMWAANGMEIALSDGVSTDGKIRNGGFYLTFGLLTALFYLADRVGFHTDDGPVNKAVEILDSVVEHVGGIEHVASVASDIDAHSVAEAVVESSDLLEAVDNGLP